VRYFNFPKTDKKKLQQVLFYELKKFIPFSPEEVYFDFFILKDSGPKDLLILLAAAKKDYIDKILEIFEKVNVKVSEINLDSICLINLFLDNYEDSTKINTCILDIGYNFSTMTILNKGIPFLTRDVKLSTKDIFQVVSRMKDIKLSDLEGWLRSLKESNEFLDLAKDNIFNLCREIKSSFDYFEVNKGERIDKVCISGGLVSINGIDQIFKDALEIDVDVLKLASKNRSNLSKDLFGDEFSSLENSLSVSFGLVL